MNQYTGEPLVSIVTVVFNGVNTIERTIESVIGQSYKNIEYIVIDGGSTDGTLAIIDRYKASIATLVTEKDKGIADAMNKGIALANGQLIGLINADDWFETDAVQKVAAFSANYPGAIIHGDMRVYSDSVTYYLQKAPAIPNLNKGMELNHPSVFVPRAIYQKHGTFNTQYRIVFDWELMLRFKLTGINFKQINEVLSNFSVGGVSTQRAKELVSEMHQIRNKYKVYRLIDKYYVINKFRLLIFGSSVIKISQKIRLMKHRLGIKN